MTFLMPLICLPLGTLGVIGGLLIGFLMDNILIVVGIEFAARQLARGHHYIWHRLLDTRVLAEAALIATALPDSAEIPRDLVEIQHWISERSWSLPFIPLSRNSLRVAATLFQVRDSVNTKVLTAIAYAASDAERRTELLSMAIRAAALTRQGTDSRNLRLSRALCAGLNIDETTYARVVQGEYGLDAGACNILGVGRHADHESVLKASRKYTPEHQKMAVQDSLLCLESQLDLIARHLAIR